MTIFTHVKPKVLKGLQNLAKHEGKTLYIHPVPYGKENNLFTVVLK